MLGLERFVLTGRHPQTAAEMVNRMAKEKHPQAYAETPQLRHFSQSLPMLLLRGREAVMRHFRIMLRRHELTEQQWRVLRALSVTEEIELSQLARATCLLAPSLSRIVRDLEQRGLMVRRSDADDQRRSLIRMTRAGQKLIDRISPHSEDVYAHITRRFGERKLKALQELLFDLEASMVASTDPDNDPDELRKTSVKSMRSHS